LEHQKETGYRILTGIYLRLGMKQEAVEASRQAMTELGDKAHLRARLGYTCLAVGDQDGAREQYRVLQQRFEKAADANTRRLYSGWAHSLFQALQRQE
jgi:hypothetical protein